MEENIQVANEIESDNSWKIKTLVFGAVLGALTGLGAAYLLTRRAERSGQALTLSTGKGMKLGMLLVGMLKQILQLGEE